MKPGTYQALVVIALIVGVLLLIHDCQSGQLTSTINNAKGSGRRAPTPLPALKIGELYTTQKDAPACEDQAKIVRCIELASDHTALVKYIRSHDDIIVLRGGDQVYLNVFFRPEPHQASREKTDRQPDQPKEVADCN